MKTLPTLRLELITALAIVFAGAFVIGSISIAIMLPLLESAWVTALYIFLLLVGELAIFAVFGRSLVQQQILAPIDKLVEGAEAIARGELDRRLPAGETREIQQLSDALNRMAERLIADQELLSANIRSLDDTNQLLTEARDAMVHAEKLASAGRLAAGIAHEIGNPLGAILGYVGLARRNADDRAKELLEAAEREARRIDRIVHGLLDYSRPRDARIRPLDINTVVNETVELLQTQGRFADVRSHLALDADLPLVECDPYQLQQVLVNLLMNAADAMEGRSEPLVRVCTLVRKARSRPKLVARRKDDPPTVNYAHRRRLSAPPAHGDPAPDGADVVEITVEDNGPGISEELLSQVFEPFVTTKEPGKGTGLGLAVCARLIDGMGGVIRAESPKSGGALFTIVLPAAAGAGVHASV